MSGALAKSWELLGTGEGTSELDNRSVRVQQTSREEFFFFFFYLHTVSLQCSRFGSGVGEILSNNI